MFQFVNDLLQKVEAEISGRKLLCRGQAVLVAVSGGVDSMVLLRVMAELSRGHGWRLTVAHFNHRLRGRSSDADERFVRRTAEVLGLKCLAESGDVRAFAKERGWSVEMAARQLRHEFLARAAKSCGAKAVAVGHHADDQVELFFIRMLRGTSGVGMRWANPSPMDESVALVRPLLGCSREEIAAFARSQGIDFREDASNGSKEFLRNRIRHELIPLLEEKYQPAVRKVVLREMEIQGAEAELATNLAVKWRRQGRKDFAKLPVAVQRRVLHSALLEQDVSPTYEMIEALRCGPSAEVNVEGGRVVHDGVGGVEVMAAKVATPTFDVGAEVDCDFVGNAGEGSVGGLTWHWELGRMKREGALRFRDGTEWFDAGEVGARVTLRHWRRGDRFQPIGMERAVKLQDLFTNMKVPREERHRRVVAVTAEWTIWWVEGLRIGEMFKIQRETGRFLKWMWNRDRQGGKGS